MTLEQQEVPSMSVHDEEVEEEEEENFESLYERYKDVLDNPSSGITRNYKLKKEYKFVYGTNSPVFSKGLHYLRKQVKILFLDKLDIKVFEA